MWPFSSSGKSAPAAPRMQTLGQMIAFSLRSETIRTTWKAANDDKILVSKDLGITIDCRWSRSNYCYAVKRANGHDVPLKERDKNEISEAITIWREWDDDRKRANALVAFVDKFDEAFGTEA